MRGNGSTDAFGSSRVRSLVDRETIKLESHQTSNKTARNVLARDEEFVQVSSRPSVPCLKRKHRNRDQIIRLSTPSAKQRTAGNWEGWGWREGGRGKGGKRKNKPRQSINPRYRCSVAVASRCRGGGDVHGTDERGLGEHRVIIKPEQSSGTCKTQGR